MLPLPLSMPDDFQPPPPRRHAFIFAMPHTIAAKSLSMLTPPECRLFSQKSVTLLAGADVAAADGQVDYAG